MGFLFYGHGSTGSAVSRVRDGQVQSYPSKHIRDSYLTSEGWLKLLSVVVEG